MEEREEDLTLNQQIIYKELTKLDKKSGIAFIGALKVLKDTSNPDRFYQAANSIRHLGAIISRQIEVDADEDEIEKLEDELNQIMVDKEIANKYNVKIYVRESSLKDKLKNVIIESPEILPVHSGKRINSLFQRWLKLHRHFTGIAHYGSSEIDPVEFDKDVKELENILLDLLEPPQEIIAQLDELIAIQKPTQDDIEKLIKLIKHPSHTQYFFTRLESPEWIDALNENEFFSEPKETTTHSFMISFFAPLSYLVRMSSVAPDKILEVLKKFQNTKNYRLYRPLLNCLTKMPTYNSRQALNLIAAWMSHFYSTSELIELKRLVKLFIEDKDYESVTKLLSIILRVEAPKLRVEGEDLTKKLYFLFNDFEDFSDILINLETEKQSCRFINLLSETLTEIIKHEIIEYHKLNEKISGVNQEIPSDLKELKDNSNIWRPMINNYGVRNEKNIIVDKLLWALQKLKDADNELFIKCLRGLSKYNLSIFKRIQLYFYNEEKKSFNYEIKQVLNDKKLVLDRNYWNELFFILKNNFNSLEESERKNILEWIEEDYIIDLSHMELSEEEEKEWKKRFKRKRMKRILGPIVDYLDGDYKDDHKDLISEITNTETPKAIRQIEPVSFYSPIDDLKHQILNKTVDEILVFLKEWIPDENKIFSESKEDLGIALSRLIEENPSDYVKFFEKLEQIPNIFISSILKGFTAANRNNHIFNYKTALNKIQLIIEISESEELYEYKIKLSLLEYIENCIRRDDFDFSNIDKGLVLNFIMKSALNQENNIEPYDNIRNDLEDKVFYYYDNIKGKAIEVLLLFAAENKKNHSLTEELLLKIISILDKLMEQENSQAELIRALLASNILKLFYINEEWTKSKIFEIFPKENRTLWKIAWESYITTYKNHLNKVVYQILQEVYLIAVKKIQSPNLSFSALEGLVFHLLLAYVYGVDDISQDSKLDNFYKQAEPLIKERAMWYCSIKILEGIKNDQEIDDKDSLYDRILELWKYRIKNTRKSKPEENIKEFEWYSKFFSEMENISEKYLDIFLKVLEKIDGYIGVYANDILRRLKSYFPISKNKVLELLILICKSKHQDWLYTHTAQLLDELLDEVIAEDYDKDAENKIVQIVDLLVKKGYFDFERFYELISNDNSQSKLEHS